MQRRRFLQLGITTVAASAVGACGGAAPTASFGVEGVDVDALDALRSLIADGGGVHHVTSARTYFVSVPEEHRDALADAWDPRLGPGLDAGLLALAEKCPHQGCRVPYCEKSGWFECPCHGSRYTAVGERRRGPATRGMSAYEIEITDGRVLLRGDPIEGLDGEVDVTRAPEPEEHCTGG